MESLKDFNYHGDFLSDAAQCVKNFCEKNKIKYKISANEAAYGCRDAASKRFDGKKRGITLERELKTLLCVGRDNQKSVLFAVHMSAARSASFKNIKKALGISKKGDVKLADATILNKFGMRLGTVNPISLAVKTDNEILQIFDGSLKEIKRTMFTNAGELTLGIEFYIWEVIAGIKTAKIFDITNDKGDILK